MRSYSKDLRAKGLKSEDCILCPECDGYVEKASFRKHWGERPLPYELVVAGDSREPKPGDVYVIHPAHAALIDFLVESAVRSLMAEREAQPADETREVVDDGSTPRRHRSKKRGRTAKSAEPSPEVLTVDEAAARFGIPRDELLAKMDEHPVPFSVTIPGVSRRAGKAFPRKQPAQRRKPPA